MKNKYWAKNKYSTVDPLDYEIARFRTNAGKLIDEAEKRAVLDLLLNSGIDYKKDFKILDAATGPGRLAFYLSDHLREAKITGVDINENMLRRAREIAGEKKVNINFIKGDIYHLPFQKAQFDAVVGLRFSMHLPDIDSLIRELARVLKKDGILIFDIFNLKSILRLRSSGKNSKRQFSGWYNVSDLIDVSAQNGLEFVQKKGLFLCGETILRTFPEKLLFILSVFVRPPLFLQNFSTKIVLCFRKIEL
ncbi:hypothetical protein A3D03_03240 [Candidatus Gottesmanbacteria bacterium RIFCSPHIGHO2_02_FULL_40_13]|uniref:Methyltransferase domain-containing protein n=1 Tax=Candidatus Gottesmanbacteria bacterium RIFCSPHIGHO2_02_FULL_40_13 TaxID=1798384 RepID=A0A1F6A7H7_9BACT|nr:MAG: hypothetical protein A3D03_03240 [Candidatus Gottesmanbacteria bacterium RIFCSPHIGHO2_02_FULL_40_13]